MTAQGTSAFGQDAQRLEGEAPQARSAKPMRPDTPSSIPVDQPTRSGALGQRVEGEEL